MDQVEKKDRKFNFKKTPLRVIAFWAFSEAFLGGILHGFKIPFAGLFLSLIASLCITLIALSDNRRTAILKATLIVIAVKFILSPHTPPMAYVAVMVQGLAGELFFIRRKFIKPAAFCVTFFALVYSVFQQLIMLTLVFGKNFWTALDIFLNGIASIFTKQQHQYVWYIVIIYVGCFVVAGIVGGILNIRIITRIQQNDYPNNLQEVLQGINAEDERLKEKKHKSGKFILTIGIMLLLVLIISYTPFVEAHFLKGKVMPVLARGLMIIALWAYFISPLLVKLIASWVSSYQKRNDGTIETIISLIPEMKKIAIASWRAESNVALRKKVPAFITNSLLLVINEKVE